MEDCQWPWRVDQRYLTGWSLLVLLVGCGAPQTPGSMISSGGLPSWARTGTHPDFPFEVFVTAAGSSREGLKAAEAAARGEVCLAAKGSLRTEAVSGYEERTQNDRTRSVEVRTSRVLQQAECSFADAIQVVRTARSGDEWWALAVVRREEALRETKPRFRSAAALFLDRGRMALEAGPNLFSFSQAYREAMAAFEKALPLGIEVRALRGGEEDLWNTMMETERRLRVEAGRRRATVLMTVEVLGEKGPGQTLGTGDRPDPQELSAALVRLVERTGVRAQVAQGGCREGLWLGVSATREVSMRLGVRCMLRVSGQTCDCERRQCVPIDLPAIVGQDWGSPEKACRNALEHLSEHLDPMSILGMVLPGDPS